MVCLAEDGYLGYCQRNWQALDWSFWRSLFLQLRWRWLVSLCSRRRTDE